MMDVDLLPYRISENKILLENDVEFHNNTGFIGSYTVLVSDYECPKCGLEGVEITDDLMGGIIDEECTNCKQYIHTDISRGDLKP